MLQVFANGKAKNHFHNSFNFNLIFTHPIGTYFEHIFLFFSIKEMKKLSSRVVFVDFNNKNLFVSCFQNVKTIVEKELSL